MNEKFWKQKLAAYLHDPPSKALDIKTHGDRSDAAFRQAGFTDEAEIGEYLRHADHTGAAADRLPFPNSQAAGIECVFDGIRNAFRHPLDGQHVFRFHQEFTSVEQGFEGENSIQPVLTPESLAALPDEGARWRARFFAHWRLWPHFAAAKDYRLSLLPADTRIPDHTIWTHMQVVSALAGCVNQDKVWRPAFLKFQLGPVQEFIAQARSTRDLWSGSYLLSWLMAAGLKALSAEVGPDAVIFPNLRGQPLFDLHWKKELWDHVKIGQGSVWRSIEPRDKEQDLLTPNLPNIFLALVPTDQAARLAHMFEKAVHKELRHIATHVWDACEAAGLTQNSADLAFSRVDRSARFQRQAEQFLSCAWQATPWPETGPAILDLAKSLPLSTDSQGETLLDRVQKIVTATTELMPFDHRDRRYYTDDTKSQLSNVGMTWALLVALNSWRLDSVRQVRNFHAWNSGGWEVAVSSNKDSVTGREEAVAGGRFWFERCEELSGRKQGLGWNQEHGSLANRFKHDDWLGAVSLIKRLWDIAYLKPKFDLEPLKMPTTHGMARHDPMSNAEEESEVERLGGERYYAVLALDGDKIGAWVAGDLCPPFQNQLAEYVDGSGNARGAGPYYSRYLKELLVTRRPVSPSYHLQFSEALSDFALYCARPIVETFDGRLIYAGGDDVLAMLPSDTALECSRALRMAFRGDAQLKEFLQTHAQSLRARHDARRKRDPKASDAPYYQKLAAEGTLLATCAEAPGFLCRLDIVDQQNRPIPFLVPGPAADCSVGIAIAHFKSPLQDVVREAQRAEKRAKNKLGRRAVAVTLMKRSGETIAWGCHWDSGGLEAYALIVDALQNEILSAKFPHRLVELVRGYQNGNSSTEPAESFEQVVDEILFRDVGLAGERQRGPNYSPDAAGKIRDALARYLAGLPDAERKVCHLVGLCQTVAFIERNLPAQEREPRPLTSSNLEPKISEPAERQLVS